MVFWRESTKMKGARAIWKSQLKHHLNNPQHLKKRSKKLKITALRIFKKSGTKLLR
jgi:hypothetical protein